MSEITNAFDRLDARLCRIQRNCEGLSLFLLAGAVIGGVIIALIYVCMAL